MSTLKLHLGSENIDKATSGSYYLLFNGGGHTGNLDLHGSARFDYINASGLAVQNSLNVTGNQVNFGNLTGFNFNHLARIVCTGDAYINNITGNLKIGGNIDLNNNLRVTGSTHITGSLFVNGIQITGGASGGTTIINTGDTYFVTSGGGSNQPYSTGDFTVSGSLRVGSGINITGNLNQLLMISGNTSAKPLVFISGSSSALETVRIGGGLSAGYLSGGSIRTSQGPGQSVYLDAVTQYNLTFQEGILVAYEAI